MPDTSSRPPLYAIEVRCRILDHYEWRRLTRSNGTSYTFPTYEAASQIRRMCYPDQTRAEVRIVEVTP